MTSPQPRIMLWVDGDRVEIWCIGQDTAPRARVRTAVVYHAGLLIDQHTTFAARDCWMLSVTIGPKARTTDPLAEAMHALAPLHLDWQDVTTRSAVATL